MTPLSPALLVAAANAFVGLGEDGGDNRGQMVELFLREVKQPPGQPWCAAFVHHVGYWSHYDALVERTTWPLPATASCWELGDFAAKRGILREDATVGDVFLVWSPKLNRFFHTGIIVARSGSMWTTVEGNTNADGSENGYTTLRRKRAFKPADRFIRWVDLDARERAA